MNTLFNSSLINNSVLYPEVALGSIHINGYSLMSLCGSTTGVAVQNMNAYDLVAELNSFSSSTTDGGGVINKRYSNKTITLSLFIQGTSQDDLIARIDGLKKNTAGTEVDFGILTAGEMRTYKATVSGIQVPAFKKFDDFVEGISMTLLITSPFWEKNAVQVQRLGLTADTNAFVVNTGTYSAFPIVYLVANNTCNLSNVRLTTKRVGETLGFAVNIATPFVNGDLLVIDYKNKTCKKNGTEVNFTGIMRPLFTDGNIFEMDFTGTIAVDATIIYNPTYL